MTTGSNQTINLNVAAAQGFPDSVVDVATAVPAFIGYTEMAQDSGQAVHNQPIRIASMAEYSAIFGGRHQPIYQLNPVNPADPYDFAVNDPVNAQQMHYRLTQVGASGFMLFDCMQLFFANGGGTCYVVSVGDYTNGGQVPAGVTIDPQKLRDGLAAIALEIGPTMLVIPEAISLAADGVADKPWESAEYQSVIRAMLTQCGELQDRVAILDVYGSQYANAANLETIIERFQLDVGDQSLDYGMSYFPLLDTTLLSASDFDCLNIEDPSGQLANVLTWENINLNGAGTAQSSAVQADIDQMIGTTSEPAAAELSRKLMAALPLWSTILGVIACNNNQLPASSAIAGVYTANDLNRGVWNAPANIAFNAVSGPSCPISDQQQGNLNAPANGKSVNALRQFPDRGTLVWGARTLDGNSEDWRYIQIRRTVIYIQQSIKNALAIYTFAANVGATWQSATAMVSAFLQNLWARGGLLGATAPEAYTVQCGLGSTMTAQDILDGYMIVQTTLQMIRPAEYIELTFKQRMQGAD